jgi:lysophospholipase L1-like esterase
VAGDADDLVPYNENTAVLKQRYEALGGAISVIIKKGFGHEHGLPDPTPIVDFILQHTSTAEARQPVLKGIRRVVFLGDSITYGGDYVDDIDAYLFTRFPNRQFELLNLGLPSETTSGLSEVGHAGGAFPRPNLHDRLGRALEKTRPDLVIACYGINDGIYLPFSEDRFAKYQDGIRRLVAAVTAAGARIILLTPPPYDPVPVKSQSDYDKVLDRYSQWLLDQRKEGWIVVDVHSAMNRHLAARRQREPGFTFARDGIHPDSFGHWLIAEQILLALGMPAEVDGAIVETGMLRTSRGHVTELVRKQDSVSFTWTTLQPMPTNPQWDRQSVQLERITDRFNRQRLAISGLSAPRYQLFGGDTLLGTFTGEELGRGVDVLSLPNFPTNRRSADVLKLVHQRQRLLCDAWLTEVGHARPGMSKGVPLDEAKRQAAGLENRIRELAAPMAVRVRVVAAER